MKNFKFKDPNGQIHEINGPDDATEEQAFGILQSQLSAGSTGPQASAPQDVTPASPGGGAVRQQGAEMAAEDMPWYEKALVGAGGATRRAQLGVKNLVSDLSQDEKDELKEWSERKGALGAAGTAGEIGGEIALTALPGAGAAKVAGMAGKAALPLAMRAGSAIKSAVTPASAIAKGAVPAMKGVTGAGGRIVTPGLVGNAAVQGGTGAAMMAPGEGESAGGNAAEGAAAGAIITAAAGAIGKPVAWLVKSLSAGDRASNIRAVRALEKTIGAEEAKRVEAAVERTLTPTNKLATPSMLPQTTAAMANSERLGAVEAGARRRGTANFAGHDANVEKVAREQLEQGTAGSELMRRYTSPEGVQLAKPTASNVAKTAAAAEEIMPPGQSEQLRNLAGELGQHEKFKPNPGIGAQTPDLGQASSTARGALNATPAWHSWPFANVVFGKADEATMRALDEGLLSPQAFQNMMKDARSAEEKTKLAKFMAFYLRQQGRGAGAQVSGE